ncbi:GntR family transcriptional regulator [Parapusillimonas sp. JC17]|uniref:GntR family transcriptional regulator n=1 Tax=Parapusillimonas sp. JC17 TaxID=3445768 RepID=UPI003FA18DA7
MGNQTTKAIEVSRGEVVDFAIEYIRSGITEGRFAPGQRLITAEIMEDIGVSRGSLREAFSRLAAEGLLDLIPNRGALVRRLSRGELVNLFRIREVLEGLAARQAAEAINEGDNLQIFSSVWKQMSTAGKPLGPVEFSEQNSLFHSTLVSIAGNRQLADLLSKLQIRVLMFQLGRALNPEDIAHSVREHEPIARAVLTGNPDAADTAMREHLRGSCERILQMSGPLLKPERPNRK